MPDTSVPLPGQATIGLPNTPLDTHFPTTVKAFTVPGMTSPTATVFETATEP